MSGDTIGWIMYAACMLTIFVVFPAAIGVTQWRERRRRKRRDRIRRIAAMECEVGICDHLSHADRRVSEVS